MVEVRLLLVGIGPGDQRQMSARARQAIAAADLVVGYRGYLGLVADLLAGREVVAMGMTEELERVAAAYERAGQGRTVALISPGASTRPGDHSASPRLPGQPDGGALIPL